MNWYWAVYVTGLGWYPSPSYAYTLDNDNSMPNCIADPINVFAFKSPMSQNQPFPSVTTIGSQVFFAYPHSTTSPNVGQRIRTKAYGFGWSGDCATGSFSGTPFGSFQSPNVDGGGPVNCPTCVGTCGVGLNDQWSPSTAALVNGGHLHLMVTWYDTRDDHSSVSHNRYADIWGGQTTSLLTGNPFASIFRVSNGASGQTVPWDHTLALWRDYQAIGTDAIQSGYNGVSFLSAWGGDARYGGPTSVWTAHITTP